MAERLKIIADAEWTGGPEMRAATRAIDNFDDRMGRIAVSEQVAADKVRAFNAEISKLSRSVREGELSMEDAANQANRLARELGVGTQKVNKQKLSWTDFKSALDLGQQAFQVVGEAARFAYETIGEGAALNLANDQFDNLAAKIGTTSESLRSNLKAATNGMIADSTLVAGASELISLGLAKNEETAVRLGAAVGALNLDMQVLGLTLANNSTARLDSLKLSMEDVIATQRKLEAEGFSGDAFDQAVLIELEKNMELFGDASEATAGQLQIVKADWQNLVDSWKQGSAELAGPVIAAMAKNVREADILQEAYERGLLTYREVIKAQNATAVAGQDVVDVLAEYNIVLDENNDIVGVALDGSIKLSQQFEKQADAVETNFEPTNRMSDATEMLSDKQLQLSNHMTEAEASIARANLAAENARIANEGAAAAVESHSQAAVGLLERVRALEGQTTHTVNLQAFGLDTLAKAEAAIARLRGFNANDQPDPFGSGDRDFGDEFEVTNEPGSTIIQNNTFNNAANPAAVATQTAEKIGNLR